MDLIQVSKVDEVYFLKPDRTLVGTLHLTPHQLIFSHPSEEKWVPYSLLGSVECLPVNDEGYYSLELRCSHFLFFTLTFNSRQAAIEVFESIRQLTCIDDLTKLYAFHYEPRTPFEISREEGWKVYDPIAEFNRLGLETNDQWRVTNLNKDYEFSPTYPALLVVPKKITDSVLKYASKYRSKQRLPVLCYLHTNSASITRSSQPMMGVKRNRSIQDEKLVQTIFSTKPATSNLIIDARPFANAYANHALGMGTENIDFYPNCTRSFMGIENIHVVRESLSKLTEAICSSDGHGVINKIQLSRSNWLKHIRSILDATQTIVHNINVLNSHVLVHCSDGWDRTAQLTALSELCLDPFYRTIRGFAVLVEKEFCSFGFKFRSRCGHLSKQKAFVDNSQVLLNHTANPSLLSNMQNKFLQYSSAKPSQDKETCPIFHQFLDCTYQLWIQNPTQFEFNEKFLLFLHEQVYACRFGNFLFECERERRACATLKSNTYSVWSQVFSQLDTFSNPIYSKPTTTADVLVPDTKYLRYWSSLFCRRDEDLNYSSSTSSPHESEDPSSQPANDLESAASIFLKAGSKFWSDFSPSSSVVSEPSSSHNEITFVKNVAKDESPGPTPDSLLFEKNIHDGLCDALESTLLAPTADSLQPESVVPNDNITSQNNKIIIFPTLKDSPSPPATSYDYSRLSHPLESLTTD